MAAAFATALIGPAMAADSVRGVTDNEIVIGTYTDLSGVTAMWGVNNTNAWRMVFDEDQRRRRHQRPQDQVHRRGQPVPDSALDPGRQQADQPRQRLHDGRQRRHADEQRDDARSARQGRAEHLPADLGAFDVRAAASSEIRPGRLVLRSDALRREGVRRTAPQQDGLRDVAGHRLRPRRDGGRARTSSPR